MKLKTGPMILAVVVIIIIIFIIWLHAPIPLPHFLLNRFAYNKLEVNYNGSGRLIAFISQEDYQPRGRSVEFRKPFFSRLLNAERALLVYLPPGYDENRKRPYPVIFCLHGFASRPFHWAAYLLPHVEAAIMSGKLTPLVMIMPDFTHSGNGKNNPDTPYDDRTGTWYINSNCGRYSDHFFEEIVPFAFKNYNVRKDPEGIILAGTSMGGFGSLYYGITHPNFSSIIVPVYPDADLRYAVGNKRLAPYDHAGYAPVTDDQPKRITNKSVLGGIFGVPEDWLYYYVFGNDCVCSRVWKDRKAIWERMRDVNPTDVLRNARPRLRGQRYYIIVGDKDDFNFQSHIPVIRPLLEAAGARVFPGNNIIAGGRHKWETIDHAIPKMIEWLGNELEAGR